MTIENTTLKGERGWTMGRNPGAIERQEAEGQQQLVLDTALPTKGLSELPAEWGIAIPESQYRVGRPNDPLFTDVKLPKGWTILPTDHSMWSKLVDETGVERASIFYKAAYYDRDAYIRKV
jgi:hypothetical protein